MQISTTFLKCRQISLAQHPPEKKTPLHFSQQKIHSHDSVVYNLVHPHLGQEIISKCLMSFALINKERQELVLFKMVINNFLDFLIFLSHEVINGQLFIFIDNVALGVFHMK